MQQAGRRRSEENEKLDPENVVYQGRVLVSFLTLIPAIIVKLKAANLPLKSDEALVFIETWLSDLMKRAGLTRNAKFVPKSEFKQKGFLGSGGIGRFRDRLWAASLSNKALGNLQDDGVQDLAEKNRQYCENALGQ